MSPSTARGLAVLVVCLACARGTAANGVFGARGLDTAETPSTQRGFDVREADADASLPPVNDMSPHALAADAADAAAEALSLPRSTGTRFSAESLSTPPPDQRGAVVVTKPRPASVETFAVRAETATEGSVSPNTPPSSYATLLTIENYLGGSADPPFDADPDAVAAAAAAAAQFLEAEKAIARAYDAAMSAWLAAEASLDATAASVDAGVAFQERETRERGNTSAEEDAYFREKKWAYRHGVGEADDVRFSDDAGAGAGGFGESDLEQYAKAACTVSIHHKPVYVPGVFLPPKLAPSVKIPGTPPVFIPGKPGTAGPGFPESSGAGREPRALL